MIVIVMLARAFIYSFYQLKNKSLRRVVWIGLSGSAVILSILLLATSILLFGTDISIFGGFFSFLNPVVDLIMDMMGLTAVSFDFLFSSKFILGRRGTGRRNRTLLRLISA